MAAVSKQRYSMVLLKVLEFEIEVLQSLVIDGIVCNVIFIQPWPMENYNNFDHFGNSRLGFSFVTINYLKNGLKGLLELFFGEGDYSNLGSKCEWSRFQLYAE